VSAFGGNRGLALTVQKLRSFPLVVWAKVDRIKNRWQDSGRIHHRPSERLTGLELVINDEHKRRVDEMRIIAVARRSPNLILPT
jgi:hypothetical protein